MWANTNENFTNLASKAIDVCEVWQTNCNDSIRGIKFLFFFWKGTAVMTKSKHFVNKGKKPLIYTVNEKATTWR